MKPESASQHLLGITRSKAKMYEYQVPQEYHIELRQDPSRLFTLTIGLLGELAARTNSQDVDDEYLDELKKMHRFSVHFFDAYLGTQLREELTPYLLLLGAASYYLCDLPGSSRVLAERLGDNSPDLECWGLEDLLLWLLQGDWGTYFAESEGPYGSHIGQVSQALAYYFTGGDGDESLFRHVAELRRTAYEIGTPRQLLFADVCCAIVKRRFENSTWYSLPRYSGLSVEQWSPVLRKETFISELWPAQHLLGQHHIFRGKSAVVQMPTSAGKTKATEIIIRSAFLAQRTRLAVIVAPFRALCHEIRNDLVESFRDESVKVEEPSDVPQVDFEIMESLQEPRILVVTPEKLVYALRHNSELADRIGLIIYDEGHQFDSGTRGITYELLLTSLKMLIPKETQTILISAVIKNAEDIGLWLNGDDSEIVEGTNLVPTYRSIAFTSWLTRLGRLEFVLSEDPETSDFFVPRIVESQELQLRKGERKPRIFPVREDGKSVALYLGLKLVVNGSVAIFCGRKSTASLLCEKAVEAYSRGLSFEKPVECSNRDEISRLRFLCECNLGAEAVATQSAELGIFPHHGNVPPGIRLAVEYAMKEGLAKFVVCTSTLAQGVNLPIRYLIVTSTYQGRDQIKVRDFHNLIGRAGRSGMHTEGSILFADPVVYDEREADRQGKRRWRRVKRLLEPRNSEPCVSTLLSVFNPLRSNRGNHALPIELFFQAYANGQVETLARDLAARHSRRHFTVSGLAEQIEWRMSIISAVESYLMAHWADGSGGLVAFDVVELATETLAYFLAEDEKRKQIVNLFQLVAVNIERNVPDMSKRKMFAKTLYGVQHSIAVEAWTREHIQELISCTSYEELLAFIWPLMSTTVYNNTFEKCNPPEVLLDIALNWLQGAPFYKLLALLTSSDARIGAGSKPRYPTMDHTVDICENALAYHGTLLVGAICEIVGSIGPPGGDQLLRDLKVLQKRLRYGLPSTTAITLCEMGFADRIVSMELASVIGISTIFSREVMLNLLKRNEQELRSVLIKYPRYFTHVFNELV